LGSLAGKEDSGQQGLITRVAALDRKAERKCLQWWLLEDITQDFASIDGLESREMALFYFSCPNNDPLGGQRTKERD
jgi:hypothetical protein